ncbi:MAG: hypothetical protein J6K19_03995 [Prevotella sp.]|nr:hypothetical protein [Prevotella sp.]
MAQQLTISVEDPSTLRTLRSLFKSMNGVSIIRKSKAAKPATAKTEESGMSKSDILDNIDNAFKELKMNLEGKLEFKPAEELLDEL